MDKTYTRKDIDNKLVELTITIPHETFKKSYDTVFTDKSKGIDLKGFRKGKTPKNLLEKQLKPEVIIDTFERLAPIYVAQAVTQENIEVVAPPKYKDIPQIELGKDLTFKVELVQIPPFKVGDLKKIKVKSEKVEVTKEEIDNLVKEIEKSRKTKAKAGTAAWVKEIAKELDLKVDGMDSLRTELERLLREQKQSIIKRDLESEVLKQAIELSKIEIPEEAVHFEAHEREHAFMDNLAQRKISADTFMKANDISIETMRDMWHKDALEALKNDRFLKQYQTENKLEVTQEDLQKEIAEIKEKNGNISYDYDNPEWQAYIKRVLEKERAFKHLLDRVLPKK